LAYYRNLVQNAKKNPNVLPPVIPPNKDLKQLKGGKFENALARYSCKWKKHFEHHGTLILTPTYLYFTASFFGIKTELLVPFEKVVDMEKWSSANSNSLHVYYSKNSQTKTDKLICQFSVDKYVEAQDLIVKTWNTFTISSTNNTNPSNSPILTNSLASKEFLRESNSNHSPPSPSGTTSLKETKENNGFGEGSLGESSNEPEMQGPLLLDDWDELFEGAEVKMYSKDQTVLEEGKETTQSLFCIELGTCRVEQVRPEDDKIEILGIFYTKEMFGEISFLRKSLATASVIANEDGVLISAINGATIERMKKKKKGFAGRFYRYLATVISTRLKKTIVAAFGI